MKTCLIKIPQDTGKSAEAFEDVFSQLHETLRGKTCSFELIASSQNIGICFSAEDATSEVIKGQIYAFAPNADIIEIPDHFSEDYKDWSVLGFEMALERNSLFPLKDYREFKGDPLSGLLSVLSRCRPGELVFIQLVTRPQADTAGHNFNLRFLKFFARLRHFFRLKYWVKRQVSEYILSKLQEKSTERLFKVNMRVAVLASDDDIHQVETRLEALFGALSNFNTLDLNQFVARGIKRGASSALYDFSRRSLRSPFYLSTKEMATLWHLSSEKEAPNLLHVLSQKQAPPRDLPTVEGDPEISFFGETNFRDQRVSFGIKRNDRRRHLYIVGKSGSGKSKMLELLIQNDLLSNKGFGVLDPHGDLVDNILTLIPKERVKDVVIFDPSDLQHPPSFNPLEQVPEELKMRVTIGFIEIFKKLFGTNWSPRLEHVLRYTTLALLDSPGTTVLSILKMLTDKRYRQSIVANIKDNVVKNFWVTEFAAWSEKFDNEAITPLINKVGQFVATNMIRNIVGQPHNRFDFRRFMDERKIVLMKVSKGILGEENASLLGAIVVTKFYQAAMSRADTPEKDRVDFYFYVDEFQYFATETFGEILTEARKYRLNLCVANQFLGQLDEKMRRTVFGNVGSLISFRVGADDARIMAEEFKPRFNDRDIINLGVREFMLKMSIDGEIKEAFSGTTLDIVNPAQNYKKECVEHSRKTYALPLAQVEEVLKNWEEGDWGQPGGQKRSGPDAANVTFEEPLI